MDAIGWAGTTALLQLVIKKIALSYYPVAGLVSNLLSSASLVMYPYRVEVWVFIKVYNRTTLRLFLEYRSYSLTPSRPKSSSPMRSSWLVFPPEFGLCRYPATWPRPD
jgi:hypothetical protein